MKAEARAELIRRAGRVAVLMGGSSAEREVSLSGGRAVLRGLQATGIDAFAIDAGSDLVLQLLEQRPDRVFNMLHGRGGEDGTLQGLLQLMGIPCTGSGVLASALAMDKLRTKLVWRQLGLGTADFEALSPRSDWQSLIDRFGTVVVKPANEGSSIGISIAADAAGLEAAYRKAAEYDASVFAEKYILGEEYTVAILQQVVLPAIRLKTNREFYDYEAKYVANDTQYICPVDLPPRELQRLNALCLSAFNALGCAGWGRIDVMRDLDGAYYLIEVNTVPGMTDHSLVPMAARQAGISFEDLLLQILFARADEPQENRHG